MSEDLDLFPPTLDDVIAELSRESIMRESVYPRFIASKKLTPYRAKRQQSCLQAAIELIKTLRQPQPVGLTIKLPKDAIEDLARQSSGTPFFVRLVLDDTLQSGEGVFVDEYGEKVAAFTKIGKSNGQT